MMRASSRKPTASCGWWRSRVSVKSTVTSTTTSERCWRPWVKSWSTDLGIELRSWKPASTSSYWLESRPSPSIHLEACCVCCQLQPHGPRKWWRVALVCVRASIVWIVSFSLENCVPLEVAELACPHWLSLCSDRGDLYCAGFPSGIVKMASCLKTLSLRTDPGPSFWKGTTDSLTQTPGTSGLEASV